MPKIVDHDERRDQIALVACRVVRRMALTRPPSSVLRAKAGYNDRMVVTTSIPRGHHHRGSRLILRRIEERLTEAIG